jgi:hypothetical protein
LKAERPQQLDNRPATVWTPVRIISAVAIGVAIAGGVWARISGLAFSSLAGDEYYFVQSIRRIMATGLPGFESGGYYVRGWLIQYLTVPAMWASGSDELGVRIPSVLFGLATASAAYLYGRRTIGRPWALALCAMVLLSSWEVEFSRFGRMYAGFQFATLAFLISLHDVIGRTRGWRIYLPVVFCLAATGTHALAVFLTPLLFLPVVLPDRVERFGGSRSVVTYSLASLVPLLVGLAQRQIDFRGMGVENARPADFVSPGGSGDVLPTMPFGDAGAPAVGLVAVAILGVLAFAWWRLRGRALTDEAAVVAVLCLLCALGHFLFLGGLLGLLLIVRYGLPRTAAQHRAAFWLGLTAFGVAIGWVAYAGWLTYGVGSRAWIASTGEQLFSQALLKTFLWPDPSDAVLTAWFTELPVLAWLFTVSLALQFVLKARMPLPDVVRNPAFFVGYVLLTLGIFTPSLTTTRYTYFAYPVALAMLALSVRDVSALVGRRRPVSWAQTGLGVGIALALFAVGGDFSPRHLTAVSSYESTYRMGSFQDREDTWYTRDDDAATAAFVRENAQPGDLVIVAETPVISHYLGREHVVYLDRRGHRFRNVSRARGTLDLWSNQRLVGTLAEVGDLTRCLEGDVWIVRTLQERRLIDPPELWDAQLVGLQNVFQNGDDSQDVLRVSLRPAAACE